MVFTCTSSWRHVEDAAQRLRTFSNNPSSRRSFMKILPARMGPTVWDELGPTVAAHMSQTNKHRKRSVRTSDTKQVKSRYNCVLRLLLCTQRVRLFRGDNVFCITPLVALLLLDCCVRRRTPRNSNRETNDSTCTLRICGSILGVERLSGCDRVSDSQRSIDPSGGTGCGQHSGELSSRIVCKGKPFLL
jgi:hypothetical protein